MHAQRLKKSYAYGSEGPDQPETFSSWAIVLLIVRQVLSINPKNLLIVDVAKLGPRARH